MPDPAVYRVEEVAELLGIGRRQCYELIRRGELPGILRLGSRSIRISRFAFDQWLSGPTTGTEEAEPNGAAPLANSRGDPDVERSPR
jgi:excisionase family DNA binding protein